MEKYQKYFGLVVILQTIHFGPGLFVFLETEVLDITRVITIWESHILIWFVSVGAAYVVFVAWIHVCLYVFLIIVVFLNSTRGWLQICW